MLSEPSITALTFLGIQVHYPKILITEGREGTKTGPAFLPLIVINFYPDALYPYNAFQKTPASSF
jgi:hypothetical protein